MNQFSKIYVAGHRGLVGSALVRCLKRKGYEAIVTRSHAELDLESQNDVIDFFKTELPEYVFLAAAKVGGIHANSSYPADFLLRNLKIQTNVIEAAWKFGVKGLLFLGSSCIYPKYAPQPLKEEYLLTGPLEPTNEPYALAKIAGIKLCEAYNRQYGTRFLSVMPTNLYGPNDNYHLQDSHVLPALIRKFHLAKAAAAGEWDIVSRDESRYGAIPADFAEILISIAKYHEHDGPEGLTGRAGRAEPNSAIKLWGTGTARREFLYSDDLGDACIMLMERLDEFFEEVRRQPQIPVTISHPEAVAPSSSASEYLINIGCGTDLTINELATKIAGILGFNGPIDWDSVSPDGTPQKLLDISRISRLGWAPSIDLDSGIRMAYADYLAGMSK